MVEVNPPGEPELPRKGLRLLRPHDLRPHVWRICDHHVVLLGWFFVKQPVRFGQTADSFFRQEIAIVKDNVPNAQLRKGRSGLCQLTRVSLVTLDS
jgi:hypothetical protein